MLNQKGIAFIHILIWSVAILLTGTVAVKEELIKVNLSGNGPLIQGADVIPTPSPTPTPEANAETVTPSPNLTPSPIQQPPSKPRPIATLTPSYVPTPTATSLPKPAFDWSTYRAARIESLKNVILKRVNEDIVYFEKEKAKYAQYSDDAVALYQSGQRTVEEFNKVVESLDKADTLIESNLQELYRDREKYTTLLRRLEAGENTLE